MPKAEWNGSVIADSSETIVVEGNHYFPPDAVNSEYLKPSDNTTHCPWKGDASYYHVVVEGQRNENAAWYYPAPKDAASKIKGYIAFWNGVSVA